MYQDVQFLTSWVRIIVGNMFLSCLKSLLLLVCMRLVVFVLSIEMIFLAFGYALALLEACAEYAQTISDDVGQAFLQSALPQLYLVYHHSELGPCVVTHPSQHADLRNT